MSKIDLGSVSAFDIAVKNGYAGTEADWVNDIANASENAEAAQQSATQAASAAAASRADYTEVMSGFDVLSARMDEFTSLEEGSTTGDAELADIRVGYDGTTYDSAGTAVRTQASHLVSLINDALSNSVKQALLSCFEHVAWSDEHGQDYIDALEDALYPPANLVSISATYVQSGTVLDTDSLDSLKSDLTVTALYDNGTTQTITTYVLSGTLARGTSTITVTYGGKTTTFDVTVKGTGLPDEYQQVEWITNYGSFEQADAKPTITLPLDDVLEVQFDMVNTGGGGTSFTSNISNTNIAFYNGGIYYDLNNARAGFLALTANAVNTVQFGNHFVKSVELGTEKTNTTQTGLGEVTWTLYTNWSAQGQHIKYIKQFHGETLVKHYVPCYLKETERTGYYDVVNEVFVHGDKNQEVGDDV